MKAQLPSTADLEYFLAVAKEGTLSRAAERIGVSQPSLSIAMQRLEASMGVTLLLRSKTGIKLTAQGRRLVRSGQTLVEQWSRVIQEAARDESEISGRYTLGAHPSVALYSFAGILQETLKIHPNIEFRFNHGLSRQVTADVVDFKIDFAVVINPVPHPDLVMKKLGEDEVGFWVAKESYLEDVLIYDDELQQSQDLIRKISQKMFKRSLVSGNLEIVAHLTSEGCGVGILPGRVAERSLHRGLKKWSRTQINFIDKIYFIYRKDLQKSSSAQKLAHLLFQRLKTQF